ncbi:MAG: hypothetical protein WA962_05550 [Ornithinimicrobium sp.]
MDTATVAGTIATAVFAGSTAPMVWRAARTRDMTSYSRPSLALTNVANAIHTVYVLSLPLGPVYVLHSVHVVVAFFMLCWHVRHVRTAPKDRLGKLARPVARRVSSPELTGRRGAQPASALPPGVRRHSIGARRPSAGRRPS